jgi:uncharacterized protein (DUF1697 family)
LIVTQYIAFLRAINVGGRFIKMEALRGHFAALGLTNVETFINSGNVIFEARAARTTGSLEKKIEAALRQAMGYEVNTFIRSAVELAELAAYQPPLPPLPAKGGLYLAFVQAPPGAPVIDKLAAAATAGDQFHVYDRHVYWWRDGGYSDSPLSVSGRFEKLLGVPTTVRNTTTVQKLAAKYPPRA